MRVVMLHDFLGFLSRRQRVWSFLSSHARAVANGTPDETLATT
jgi:hypothetical protein